MLGRGAYVGPGVQVGDNVKIQNYALVYEPAVVEDGVFIGPAAVLTNDMYPRAVTPTMSLKSAADWHAQGVVLRRGSSIGARAVVLAGVTVGRWAVVGAGAVVTRDVPDARPGRRDPRPQGRLGRACRGALGRRRRGSLALPGVGRGLPGCP